MRAGGWQHYGIQRWLAMRNSWKNMKGQDSGLTRRSIGSRNQDGGQTEEAKEKWRKGGIIEKHLAWWNYCEITPRQQFSKFLASGENKNELGSFLINFWSSSNIVVEILNNKELYVAHLFECHVISSIEGKVKVLPVEELFTDQEEADTRLLLHAYHASNPVGVVISSCDTDVFILAIAFISSFNVPVYIQSGKVQNSMIIKVNTFSDIFTDSERKALLGFHAVTGCDTVSSFKGKGKIKPFEILRSDTTILEAFGQMGDIWDIQQGLNIPILEKFICNMYGLSNCNDIDEARYILFKMKTNFDSLPPTKNSLLLHFKRANYQAALWKRSLKQYVHAPEPEGFGWAKRDGKLCIEWCSLPPIPENLKTPIKCSCKKTFCSTNICSCIRSKVQCSTLCDCTEKCKNTFSEPDCSMQDLYFDEHLDEDIFDD